MRMRNTNLKQNEHVFGYYRGNGAGFYLLRMRSTIGVALRMRYCRRYGPEFTGEIRNQT